MNPRINTIITIETESCKITKELKESDSEDWSTCDSLLEEFITILVAAGWQPSSIKSSIIDIANRYKNQEGTI